MSKKFCLVSVSDKSSLNLVLPVLKKHAYTLLSTGGTYEFIKKNGFNLFEFNKIMKIIHLDFNLINLDIR